MSDPLEQLENSVGASVDHPMSALPEVSEMRLDLTKEEKLRTAALLMGIKYYTDTIIKDSAYLQVMIAREKEMQFSNAENKADWCLRPANVRGVVECAQWFEAYLLGAIPNAIITIGGREMEPQGRATESEVQAETESTAESGS